MKNFCDKLYNLRKLKGISQEELGFELGVSRQTVSKWELGTAVPDVKNLIALCEFFSVDLEWLIYGAEEKNGESVATEADKQINGEKKKKFIFLKILLALLIPFAVFLIAVIFFIALSLYSLSGNSGVEGVSVLLMNLSLMDVLLICVFSFIALVIFIVLIIYFICKGKNKTKKRNKIKNLNKKETK